MSEVVHIGAERKAVEAVAKAIMDIIKQPVGDNVKIKALEVLAEGAAVGDVQMSNCSFVGGQVKRG